MVANLTGTGFATSYNSDSVKSSTSKLVVAPGTNGTVTFTISGSAEVTGKATFDWTLTDNVFDGTYYPIDWTFGSDIYSGDSVTSTGAAATGDLDDLAAAIETYTINFDAGASISETFSISWNWAFETGADDVEKAANNKKDAAIAKAGKTLSYELTAKIEQTKA